MGAWRPSVIEALELGLMIRIRRSDMAWIVGQRCLDEVIVLRIVDAFHLLFSITRVFSMHQLVNVRARMVDTSHAPRA